MDGLCGVVPDRGTNRNVRGRSAADGVELPVAGGLMRLDGPAASELPDGWLDLDGVSFRRAVRRSNSDPRDALLLSEMLGEEACGVGPAALSVPSRLPILPVPLGLPTSDGCGKDRPLSCVFGENRNVLGENELDRSGLVLGAKLRGLGALGVKLGAAPLRIGVGAWLAGGLNEGRDGAAWNDLPLDPKPLDGPEPNDGGLEGIAGAGLGWLNDGLG